MKKIFLICLLLIPRLVDAKDVLIQKGISQNKKLTIEYMRETMIVFPERALSITGTGEPDFQVQPLENKLIITSLRRNSRGNLFIELDRGTIIALDLRTGPTKDKLISIKYQHKAAPDSSVSSSHTLQSVPSTSRNSLGNPWEVRKLKAKEKSFGIELVAHYLLRAGDERFLNFTIKNKGKSPFEIDGAHLMVHRLGGFKGNSVLHSKSVSSEKILNKSILSSGESTSGTIIFHNTYLEHDQVLVLKISNQSEQGPELRLPR